MKETLKFGLIVLLGASLIIGYAEPAPTAPAKPIVLRMASGLPVDDASARHLAKPYMAEVEKRTGGRVKFDAYYGGTLCKIQDLLATMRGKAIDGAITLCQPMTPSDNPYCDVTQLPYAPLTGEHAVRARLILMENPVYYEQEYKKNGVVSLLPNQTPPYFWSSTKKKITKVEDFRGLRARTPNPTLGWYEEALGLTPVFMPGIELAGALERGVVDGTYLYLTFWASAGVQDRLKYTIRNVSFGSYHTDAIALRQDVFDSLPKDIQEIMVKVGKDMIISCHKSMDKEDLDLVAQYTKQFGAEFYDLPKSEVDKIQAMGIKVWHRWVAEKQKAGATGARDVAIAWKKALEKVGIKVPDEVIPAK